MMMTDHKGRPGGDRDRTDPNETGTRMSAAGPCRRVTHDDMDRGWLPLACGCHGRVLTTDVLYRLPDDLPHGVAELCPKSGLLGVPIDVLRSLG